MSELQFHPLADFFPLMKGIAFKTLVYDIQAYGLNEPITMFEGKILDGRNRYRACIELGLEPTYRPFTGDDPATYVISANICRRHLSTKEKRELISKLLRATPEKSDRQIAETVKADHKTIGAVRIEQEARGEIPHVETREDARGRQQPATKKKRKPGITHMKEDKRGTLCRVSKAQFDKGLPTAEEVGEMPEATRQQFFAQLDLFTTWHKYMAYSWGLADRARVVAAQRHKQLGRDLKKSPAG